MLKFGVVTQVNEKDMKVRVSFPELNIESYWLPVMVNKTFQDKVYWMPDIQEHVVCMMDSNLEAGVVMGAIYSSSDKPPANKNLNTFYTKFKDGTEIEFNRETKKLNINISDGKHLKYDGGGTWHIQGNLVVSGNISDLENVHNTLDHLRQTYNNHNHPGDSGGTTGTPNQTIN